MSSGPNMTPAEDATIRDLVATQTYAQIAALLGRSVKTVRNRARALGAPTPLSQIRRQRSAWIDLAREIAEARAEMATAPLYRGGWP